MDVKRLGNGGRRLLYAATAILALVHGGCLWVAAGAAEGAAVGAAYVYGKDCLTLPSSLDDTSAATKSALADLGMQILAEQRDGSGGFIKSQTSDGETVRIHLDPEESKFPADGPLTMVTVRVGAFGDHPVSHRVIDQISAHLVPTAVAAGSPPGTVVPASATGPGSLPVKPVSTTKEPPMIAPPAPPPGAFPPTTAPPPELPAEPAK